MFPKEETNLTGEHNTIIQSDTKQAAINGNTDLPLRNPGKVVITAEDGSEKVADGVYLSNTDLGWYTADSKPHPLFEKYKGQQFSLRYRITDVDKLGKEHDLEYRLLSPFPLGEMGPTDWQGIPEGERLEAELAVKVGMFNGFEDPGLKHLLKASSSAYVAFTGPNKPLLELEPYIVLVSFAFNLDDQMDNNNVFKRQLSFQQISEVMNKLIQVVRGEKDPEELKVDFDFPYLTPLARYLKYLRKILKERAATDEIFNRFVVDITSYMNAVALGTSSEWTTFTADPSKNGVVHRTHWDLRRRDSAGRLMFTTQFLSNRNKLSREIHEGHLWTQIRDLGTTHLALVNDLMSYKKEMGDKETCNAIYDRHVLGGRSFVEAINSCVEDCNNVVKDIVELEKLMLKLYNNDEELTNAFYLVKASLLGHIHWYNYALRYHNGIIFDCIVHERS